jgi:TetR/AcrR family transcriptional repressor of nem operon
MARPREFDKGEALQKAIDVFWRQGYEATSMHDLVGVMGINRQSLYDTFGDKHALYLSALESYRLEREKDLLALLDAPGSIKRKLRKVCEKAIEESVTDETRRGCFMNNAFVDMVTRDQQTEEQAVRHVTIVEKAWEKAIARGQESGEITKKHSASSLARYFYNALNGLRVTAKTNTHENALKDIVKVTLSMFD